MSRTDSGLLSGRNLGWAYLAVLGLAAVILRDVVLEWFEVYDHFLDGIAFKLISGVSWLPNIVAHDGMMAVGFFALGLAAVILPAVLGVRRGWIVVGLVFLALHLAWWYSVESDVARELDQSLYKSIPILRAYFTYAAGAFVGAFLGEWTIARLSGRGRRSARGRSANKH